MWQGFTGWHALILLIVAVVIPVGVVIVIVMLVRRGTAPRVDAPPFGTPSVTVVTDVGERLAQLDALRAAGSITEGEYEAKRAQIIGEL